MQSGPSRAINSPKRRPGYVRRQTRFTRLEALPGAISATLMRSGPEK